MLLEQRDQEVDGQVDVLDEFILGHLDVADGDVQAQDLKNKKQVSVSNKGWASPVMFFKNVNDRIASLMSYCSSP